MALVLKLSGAEYEKLSTAVKALYVADGDDFKLDVSDLDDVGPLKRAKEHEKEQRLKAEKRAKEAEEKLETLQEEITKKSGNVQDIEENYKKKLLKAQKEKEELIASSQEKLRKVLITDEARRIALDIATNADTAELLMPRIVKRLQANLDGDDFSTTVLNADGTSGTMTIKDLAKEFQSNPAFSAIIRGSGANGGGANGGNRGQGSGATKSFKDMNEVERTALYLADPIAYKMGKESEKASGAKVII